ncbi:NACHT, LRR and PYD domains-containing protein 3-like, partial [Callorhinchus milii]|uniref:NACHT, LRR and PYD domains-containing protein 3-like n=1 Tax=Callorhinchus milii TaxID=7868 RepID=UPI001C3F6BA4
AQDTFRQMLADFSDKELYRVTRFYLPRLQAVVEDFVKQFGFELRSECIISEDEAAGINQLVWSERDGEAAEFAVKIVLEQGPHETRAMWDIFVKLHPTKHKLGKILREIKEKGNTLLHEATWSGIESQVSDSLERIQSQHKETLREQNKTLTVNTIRGREKRTTFSLSARYTKLILISSPRDQSLVEHELLARGRDHEEWQKKHTKNQLERIHMSQLLRSSFCKNSMYGTSVVGGVAGIGKTTLVQKMVHDWATGKIYPQFHFVFHFTFRELNVIRGRINLRDLILNSYPYLSSVIDQLWKEPGKLLFIFDGLDEFKDRIDFTDTQRNTEAQYHCLDPHFWCEVSDIVRCLVQRKVLPGCSVLITTRPTALQSLLQPEINLFAEIQGFLAEERKEYFQKFFEDVEIAVMAFTYVEANPILYTMCYNPSYCGILCSSLECFFTQKKGKERPFPKTITQLYVNHIYNILTNHGREIENPREVLRKTGEMALLGVRERTIVFSSQHFRAVQLEPCQFLSGFMMELLEKDSSAHNMVYTFHHLTIQEFVAALAQFLTPYILMPTHTTPPNLTPLLDIAHSDRDGRFQIFLRFLIGLSDPYTKSLLNELLGTLSSETTRQVIDWIQRIFENIGIETSISGKSDKKGDLLNILHYLFESQNKPLMKATIGTLKKIDLSRNRLSPVDCIVMAADLQTCEMVEEIDLDSCYIQTEGIQRLVSVLHRCKSLRYV